MKVVLLKSVDNLGQAGEAVEVKRGYFRNFLGPRRFALEATKSNMKYVKSQRKPLHKWIRHRMTYHHDVRKILFLKLL